MSHIDFLIGFILTVSTVFLLVYFISNSISNNVNNFNTDEIKESSLSLEKYLFEINDDKSLISTARELQAVLTEANNTAHTEEIRISIKSQINKVKVYNSSLNEIPSSSSQLSGETIISFSLSFGAREKKIVNIFYFGDSINGVNYLTNNNISLRILSDKELNVVSQEKCSRLQSNSYDVTRKIFGFKNQFRIDLDDCSYGPQPSISANIILKSIPVIYESSDGLLQAKIARLRIW